jgi:hypothetical protein
VSNSLEKGASASPSFPLPSLDPYRAPL